MSVNYAKYDEHDNELYYEKIKNENFDEVFIDFVNFETICKRCDKIFSLNNKLHYYLRHDQCIKKIVIKIFNTAFDIDLKKTSTKYSTLYSSQSATMYSAEILITNNENRNSILLEIIESSTSI